MPSLAGLFDSAQSALFTLAAFALLISVVVFVHELGHLLVAKWCGVKADRFSIGFGPRLFGFQLGETEYRLSALPFGGYVKFAGDNPLDEVKPEDVGRGFLDASPGARAAIAVAGPAANFVLALVVFFLINLLPHLDLAPMVGFVKRGSPADRAGLQYGDTVLAVDGAPVRSFFEVQEKVSAVWERPIALQIERGAQRLPIAVTPALVEEHGPLGLNRSGRIGISASPRTAVVAVLGPVTPAGRAGLRTFDSVTSLGGTGIRNYEQLIALIAARLSAPAGGPADSLELKAARRPQPPAHAEPTPAPGAHEGPTSMELVTGSLRLPAPLGRPVRPAEAEELVGLACADLNIAQVTSGSAAEKAGLRRGDRLVEVQGKPVIWWTDEVEKARQGAGTAPLAVVVLRDGKRLALSVEQTLRQERDEAGVRVQVPQFGAAPMWSILHGEPVEVKVRYGPSEAISRAAVDVVEATRRTALGMVRIVTGRLSSEAVGGPLMMADVARQAADVGLTMFLRVIGWISLSLGLMNLIPIPILDGFHILSAAIEGVRRRPLSLRFREAANMVGLALVIGLMLFALKNDVVRKFFD